MFGTDVMVTVAKSFEAPIKCKHAVMITWAISHYVVVFPMDFLELGIHGTNFSLLGLGDIVLPGNYGY